MTKVKLIGKRETHILHDLQNRRRYLEIWEKAEDKKKVGKECLSH